MWGQRFRIYLERFSFYLWILFTIFAISVAGLGLEGVLFAGFLVLVSSTQEVHFPLAMVSEGSFALCLSILWRQVGINYFHYLQHDSIPFFDGEADEDSPSCVLKELIHEVESSAGYARNDARAKAKAWLLSHASALDEEDILLAKTHFGYMLPTGWGV